MIDVGGDQAGSQVSKPVSDRAENRDFAGDSFVVERPLGDLDHQRSVVDDHIVNPAGRPRMVVSSPDGEDLSDPRSLEGRRDLDGIGHPPLASRINWAASHAP